MKIDDMDDVAILHSILNRLRKLPRSAQVRIVRLLAAFYEENSDE